MPYAGTLTFASGLAAQGTSALTADFPTAAAGRTAVLTGATSGAGGFVLTTTVLTAVVSGGGASGGEVSGAQFCIDPATQKFITGYTIPSAGVVQLVVNTLNDVPVNP